MWSLYALAIFAVCGLGSIWILWCAVRDLGLALRTGQIRSRGGVIHERIASPFSYWLTFLTAVWFFVFLEAFLVVVLVAFYSLANT